MILCNFLSFQIKEKKVPMARSWRHYISLSNKKRGPWHREEYFPLPKVRINKHTGLKL
jgi:hypothetical protein